MNLLKTLKIIFPGIKYDITKPLLKSLNENINGETIYLDYSKFYNSENDSFDKENAYLFVIDSLKDINFDEYSEIILISKSIGTVLTARYKEEVVKKDEKNIRKFKYVWLTPLDEAIKSFDQTDYIVYGTNDKYLSEEARNLLKYRYVNLNVIQNGNHRLEVNNEEENDKILKNIVLEVLTYLGSSNYME